MELTESDLVSTVNCTIHQARIYVEPINITLKRFDISSKSQIAMFLAQTAHESGSFSRVVENLNYSADGLLKIFPKYFKTREEAMKFARQPEKIANRVYANRMGNGNEESKDGWNYRGRGLIQITGRSNYERLAKDLDINCVASPELLQTPIYATLSAGQYWEWKGLNNINSVTQATRLINGGDNGLEDRVKKFHTIMSLLK